MVRFFAYSVFPLLNGVTRSPSVMGILVADHKFFGEIGSLDGGMKIYGGENVELGIRVSTDWIKSYWRLGDLKYVSLPTFYLAPPYVPLHTSFCNQALWL